MLLVALPRLQAQGTATVPPGDLVYIDLDRLNELGFLDSVIVAQRPYSRRDIGRILRATRERSNRLGDSRPEPSHHGSGADASATGSCADSRLASRERSIRSRAPVPVVAPFDDVTARRRLHRRRATRMVLAEHAPDRSDHRLAAATTPEHSADPGHDARPRVGPASRADVVARVPGARAVRLRVGQDRLAQSWQRRDPARHRARPISQRRARRGAERVLLGADASTEGCSSPTTRRRSIRCRCRATCRSPCRASFVRWGWPRGSSWSPISGRARCAPTPSCSRTR